MTYSYRIGPALLALLLLVAPASLAQDDADAPTIAELAMQTEALSTLVTAVKAADLAGALSGEGPLTVFAPTNAAFGNLPAGTVETLTEPDNIDQLQGILKYHVVPGSYTAADLYDGQMLTTLAGDELEVNLTDEGVLVGGASVVQADVMASNGVVHVVDHVLLSPHDTGDFALRRDETSDTMPPTTVAGGTEADAADMMDDDMETPMPSESEMEDYEEPEAMMDDATNVRAEFSYNPANFAATRTIPQNLVAADDFDTLVQAAQAAELVDALGAEGPFTLFAPTNAAFENVDGAMMTALLDPSNKTALQQVLQFHVVPGRISSDELVDGMQLETLAGENITILANDESPTLFNANGADILVADLPASNGLIHVVNLVLLPEGGTPE